MPHYLTQAQIDRFHKDGYLVIPKFLSEEDTHSLLSRSKQLLDEFNIDDHPRTKFTTSDDNHVGDDYFLNSGDKIRYFLEEDAVDAQGKLTREKQKSVNKIGHALHELEPAFRKVTLENENLRDVVRDLKFHRDPRALQSMVITKQTHIGGEVPEHNDSYVYPKGSMPMHELIRTKWMIVVVKDIPYPPSALGFWIALEKCTESNGALSFLPGSHLTAPITKRFVRLGENKGTGFESLLSAAGADKESSEGPKGNYVLETCEPGDLVLIHGSVLHKSERNTSPHTRFAYTFHMIESPPYAKYDEKNWLQPTSEMPFSRILPPGEINSPIEGKA